MTGGVVINTFAAIDEIVAADAIISMIRARDGVDAHASSPPGRVIFTVLRYINDA